ncbi:hypothetical protein APHAL10511_002749 [Amanita phalloides]|nr:hypothetical protein APHAL10511_002749 [Amanita phalloides]
MKISDDDPSQNPTQPPGEHPQPRKRKLHVTDTITHSSNPFPGQQVDPLRNEEGERYSSDESLCTISEEEEDITLQNSPLGDLSINSHLTKKSLKRKKDEDDSEDENIDSIIQRTQKHLANRKAEIHIRPGDNFKPGFSELHYALCYNNSYMPLSIFTNDNLTVINREATSLPKISINPHGIKGKVYLLDIEKFEVKYGSFLETLGDPGQSLALRWKNHFGFFKSRRNASKIFPVIKALDIRFRKDYSSIPFKFDAALYDLELQKMLYQIRFDQLEEQLSGNKGSSSSVSSQNKAKPFARQTSNMPFQQRAGSNPSSAVCLICAKRGHMFSTDIR